MVAKELAFVRTAWLFVRNRIPRPRLPKGKKKWLWMIAITLLTPVLAFGVFLLALLKGYFGPLPDEEELSHIRNQTASEIYTADSVLIGTYFVENRTNIAREEIPQHFIDALVATEDARFYQHEGIDNRSLLRVIFKSVLGRDRSSGGGSTLSQQLAKNLYPRRPHGHLTMLVNKAREAVLATRLENIYSKDEILVLYLNTVPFGEDVYGVEMAARRFFNKRPSALTIPESATLVGMLKAPSAYNPRLHPEASAERKNVVLGQMAKYGYLEAQVLDSIQNTPIELHYGFASHNEGLATYFREYLRKEMMEWCGQHTKPDGTAYDLYTDGLKIYTTIDSRMQRYAEAAVQKHMTVLQQQFDRHWARSKPWRYHTDILTRAMRRSDRFKQLRKSGLNEKQIRTHFNDTVKASFFSWTGDTVLTMTAWDSLAYYQMILQAGFLVQRPSDGSILAWVGGIDHHFFQYDHVTSTRQAGSTFKPFVYSAAVENGATPCDFYSNKQRTYKEFEDWTPENAEEEYGGKYSLQGALAHSVNTVSVEVMMNTGIQQVITMARKFGISGKLPEVPSLALGIADVSLMEMVHAYGSFVNHGRRSQTQYITGITDENGLMLDDFGGRNKGSVRVMTAQTAAVMTRMMTKVVDEGTAYPLRSVYGLNGNMAGKTGTTQSHADGWYIGFVPGLVMGAWVGADDPSIHFRSLHYGSGAHMALPIWAEFYRQLIRDPAFAHYRSDRFTYPEDVNNMDWDCPEHKETFFESLFGKHRKDDESETDTPSEEPRKKAWWKRRR